jgi:hypothetical protein
MLTIELIQINIYQSGSPIIRIKLVYHLKEGGENDLFNISGTVEVP